MRGPGKSTSSKEEIFVRVFTAAMSLDFRKGHQRWTLSELARLSGITRSLIYYYFGKSRENILIEAVKSLGEEFFGLNNNRMKLWQQGKVGESVLLSRKFIQTNPDLAAFYILHRTKQSAIGTSIRDLEDRHLSKLNKFFPDSSTLANRARSGLLFGLVFASSIPDEAILEAVKTAKKLKLSD